MKEERYMSEVKVEQNTPETQNKKDTPWLYLLHTLITVAFAVALFALLTAFMCLEHELIFLFSVIIALFALRYSVVKALLPGILIIGLGTLVHFNHWQHGVTMLPVGVTAGLIHAYVIDKAEIDMKGAIWTVILSEILLNIGLSAVLAIIKDPVFGIETTTIIGDFLIWLFGKGEGITYFVNSGIIGFLALFGILEALFTHILVHFFAARVFKVQSGHTFEGMGIDFPGYVTIAYVVVVGFVFYSFFLTELDGFLLTLQQFAINLIVGTFIFYIFTGSGVIAMLIYRIFNRRFTPLVVTIGFVFFPFVWLIGIVDSIFNIRQKIPVTLIYTLDKQD